MTDWAQDNVVMRTGSKLADATGVTSALNVLNNSSIQNVSAQVSNAAAAGRGLAETHIIDPMLGDIARGSHKLMTEHLQKKRTLNPKFDHENRHAFATSYTKAAPAGAATQSTSIPMRMFNLRTRNVENVYPKPGRIIQYCILSHGWKGQEIEFTDIQKLQLKSRKLRDDNVTLAYPELQLPPHQSGSTGDVDLLVHYYELEMNRLRDARRGRSGPLTPEEIKLAQKRRSAYKILHSVDSGAELFEKELGPQADNVDRYIWNDTCCINKAVVGEHIESLALMGEWYTNAMFCVIHLDRHPREENWQEEFEKESGRFDIKALPDEIFPYTSLQQLAEAASGLGPARKERFYPYWSTRGWTLQELCLSRKAYFYNHKWQLLHQPRKEEERTKLISQFSRVPRSEVCRGEKPSKVSAYELLAFASQRDCTVETDRVYSMMGMLGVKFAAFHAEGLSKALVRLLDEVVTHTHDVSIFNWYGEDCGSTIPGRSLYPADLRPFQTTWPTETNKNAESNADLDIGMDSNERNVPHSGPREVVAHALRLIDKHLEIFAHFITRTDYDFLPHDSIQAILRYTHDAKFDTKLGFEFELVRKALRFLQRADQKFRVKAAEADKTRLASSAAPQLPDTDTVEEQGPPPPYEPDTLPEAEAATVAATAPDAQKFRMSSLRLGKQSLLQSKPAKEKPVEKSEKALFGRSLMPRIPENIIPGSSSKSKSDKEKVTEDAEAESGMKLDPKWFTLVENVIAYLTSLLPSKRSGPADPHQAERLKCIGKILDSLHCRTEGGGFDLQSPVFQPQWERAKYLDQMIANRILLYVIKMPFPQKLEYDTNMALWLNCIKRTDFELLSPADINQVFDIFERTPFGACPSFSEVTWSGKPDGNEDTEDSSSKKTQYLTDLDEDSEDNLLQHLPAPMISRNPIIIGPSGIEALFDIQRVIVTVLKATQVHHQPESEWPQGEALQDVVDNCIRSGNPDTVFTGKCKISTALAYIEVPFRCTAAILKRQLDLHDVLMQTDLRRPDDHQEGGQAYVMTMLQFVQEPDIELVAGEWVLARFSNVPGANWFLCVLEMGATHPYYGWRIPTGKIDFGNAQPEPELIKMWEQYMEHKKNLLCELINTRIKAQKAARNKKQTSAQREKNATLGEVGMDAVSALAKGDTTVPEAVLDAAGKIVQLGSSEIVHALTSYEKRSLMFQEYKERIDLRSRALKAANIPEVAHMAVLSLDDNSVLPAMFFAATQVHMF